MKKKVKYVKSLVIASLVMSFLFAAFGIYQLINNKHLLGVAFLFGAITMGWDDWRNLFKKKK